MPVDPILRTTDPPAPSAWRSPAPRRTRWTGSAGLDFAEPGSTTHVVNRLRLDEM